jgi:hypothetical protein
MQQYTQAAGQRAPANGAATPRRPGATRGVFATIELSRPIDSHDGPRASIDVAEPTFGDWIDCGPLFRRIAEVEEATGKVRVEVIDRPEALMAWIRRLTGLHDAEVRQMTPRDSQALRSVVMDAANEFDQAGNSPPAPTSSSS